MSFAVIGEWQSGPGPKFVQLNCGYDRRSEAEQSASRYEISLRAFRAVYVRLLSDLPLFDPYRPGLSLAVLEGK